MDCKMCLICFLHVIIVFNLTKDKACAHFNVYLYLCLACLQIGNWLFRLGKRSKVMECKNV